MSIEIAKQKLEKKIEEFCSEHGRHEPDTNAFVFDNEELAQYCEGLEDALEIVNTQICA